MIKTKFLSFSFLSLIAIVLLFGCYSSRSSYNYDYTYLYDESQKLIKPDFKLFHFSEDSSLLYYQLNTVDVLYGKQDQSDSLLKAQIWVKYILFSDMEKKIIIDSATYKLTNYGSNELDKILQAKLKFKAPMGGKYILEIRFRDENKDLNVIYNEVVDKRNNYNDQFFLLSSGEKVLITPIVNQNQVVTIKKSAVVKQDTFEVQLSDYKQGITPPPFAEKELIIEPFKLDSFYVDVFHNNELQLTKFKHTNRIIPVHVTTEDCFYYYNFYPQYPLIAEVNQMQEPIRYISTSNEYKKVINAVNTKKAIDAFWLKLGKEEIRTRKMIAEYYSRVELSNTYFTSYREGWKTDRGIIYIVYGKPTTIYKTATNERWVYGEENNILSVQFEFIKIDDLRSNNTYELIRNSDYKNNWYRAVDMWRQAKIY